MKTINKMKLIHKIIMKHLIKIALFLTTLTLFACGGGSGGGSDAPTTPAPTNTTVSIADATGDEGENITFIVTNEPAIAEQIKLNYSIVFGNQSNSANASDLTGDISGKITIATNDSSTTISIAIRDDNIKEPAETFQITLKDALPTNTIIAKATATGTIAASDSTSTIKTSINIANVTASEGENLTFKVTSAQKIAEPINFSYQVKFTGTASQSDLTGGIIGTGTIAINELSTTIEIAIFDDTITELDETFQIELNSLTPSDATFTNRTATGTILASDPVTISIADASGDEGGRIDFKVTANSVSNIPITFNYQIDFTGHTANQNDLSGQQLGNGTLAINDSSTTISIEIFDDNIKEETETFRITLKAQEPANTIIANTGTGTILANDSGSVIRTNISIADATSSSESKIIFTVTNAQAIAENITFKYNLVFDNPLTLSSASTSDFSSGSTSGEETISVNSTGITIEIDLTNDIYKESAETFQIQLSDLSLADVIFTKSAATGTILASDIDGVKTRLRISEGNPTPATEGQNITFTVTSAFAIAEPVSFDYRIVFDNPQTSTSANASDFEATSGSSTIATNDLSTTISIGIFDDRLRENAETFMVRLSNLAPSDATFTDHTVIGTISANDENGIVIISVADATASEASSDIIFQVTSAFPAVASSPFTFDYEVIVDNLTTANSASTDDFLFTTKARGTIPTGQSTPILIGLKNDEIAEPAETFRLLLTNPSANATLDSANNSAKGTIINDDLGEITGATASSPTEDSRITLNWANPSIRDFFAGVTIAHTEGTTAPAENCSSGTTTNIGKVTRYTITGLTNGTAYSFRICARSTAGNLSSGAKLENQIPDVDSDRDGVFDLDDVDDDNDGLIEIFNATQFNNIRHNLAGTSYKTSGAGSGLTTGCPNAGTGCNGYELVADIDLSGTWTPIGTFTATFDGNNNRISNLRISSGSNIGLFSILNNATIKNLKLATVSVTGAGNVGALVGQATDTTLSNIELIGDDLQSSSDAHTEIKGSGANVGGLVGHFNRGTITDASSSLTVRGGATDDADNTGGLVGNLAGGTIKNSNSSGSVSGSNGVDFVGGLVGNNNGNISNSWASGNVTSTSISVAPSNGSTRYGGLVGDNNGNISNSWASGNVSSNGSNNTSYGGLVGYNSRSISTSWASGNVSADQIVGGLVGFNGNIGHISQVWASGAAFSYGSSPFFGGLVGNNTVLPNGRNYQLDDARGIPITLANINGTGHSFVLGGTVQGTTVTMGTRAAGLTALAELSGATGDSYGRYSDWHSGIGTAGTPENLLTRFCDTDGSGSIETSEIRNDNTVWVMAGDDPSNDLPPAPMGFYAIPAIRCIANTKGITDTAEINRLRKIEIDRQRHKFPQ